MQFIGNEISKQSNQEAKDFSAKITRQVNSSLALSKCNKTIPKYQQGSAVKTIYITSRTGEVVRKLVLVF